MKSLRKALVFGFACSALTVGFLAVTPGHAAQIPAWLDDGISQWNKANPTNTITFVDIKDSYAWYTMAASPDVSAKDIRGKAYGIAYKAGYANSQDEEIVTTARPPSPNGVGKTKKCWTRSFLRDVEKGSATTVQRMLTTMVCEDTPNYALGFRVAQ